MSKKILYISVRGDKKKKGGDGSATLDFETLGYVYSVTKSMAWQNCHFAGLVRNNNTSEFYKKPQLYF